MKFGGAAWVGLGAVVLILFLPVTFMQTKPDYFEASQVNFGYPHSGNDPREWWKVGGLYFPLWRFQQPLFFCTPVPFVITRRCGKSSNGNTNCTSGTGWDDMTPAGQGLEDGYKGRSSGIVAPLSASIAEADYWAMRWNVRGRPDGASGSIMLPPSGDLYTKSYFDGMRNWAKERRLFWRVHVTGISHRGRVLRGWYHLRVRLDWDRTNSSNKYAGGSKYYVIDRLMISARGRSNTKITAEYHKKRTWNGGIGEFVYDFPACKCKGLKYPNYHDSTTWEARCNEWNPCSYDRYPDDDHKPPYGRRKGRCSRKTMGYFTPPCGTVPFWESNFGNNFMYRRAKYPAYSGTGQEKGDDMDYGPEQMDEIHVNFRLEQSFCNMYYDVDFVVDGVVIDARNIAKEVVPLFQNPAEKKSPANVDEYQKVPTAKDWNYGTMIPSSGGDSKCVDKVACVFAVERTISTRFVFANEDINPIDGTVNVSASMPTFYESADPLPTLLPSEELDCNVELKGVYDGKTTDRKPISGENFYGAIKYVYKSSGPVDEVWKNRGHTLSYYDAQIYYNRDSGELYKEEIKEVHPYYDKRHNVLYDQTIAGDYRMVVSENGPDRSALEGSRRGCGSYDINEASPDFGYHYSAVTGRYTRVVSIVYGPQTCGIGYEHRTPDICEYYLLQTDTSKHELGELSHQMALKYLYSRTTQLTDDPSPPISVLIKQITPPPADTYDYPKRRNGYQTIWWFKYLFPLQKNNKKKVSKRCRIKKLLKRFQCPNLVSRPWTPASTVGADGSKGPKVTQRVRNNVQRKRDYFNTTDRLERGMLIKNPGTWFVFDSRVMHGVHMSVTTFFFMPVSAFMARFYKETFMETRIFTHHVWYWAHLVFVWMSGASYLVGLWRQRESRYVLGVNMGMVACIHRLMGWNSTLVMLFMIAFGGIRCIDRSYRKFAAYFHAICAHVLHYSNLVCVLLSIWIPGSPSAFYDRSWYLMEREHWYLFLTEPIFQCVLCWCIFDIVMHAVMSYFQRQTDAMLELEKYLPKPRYLCPVMFPVLDENFAYDVPLRKKRIICLGIYIAGAGTMATFTWVCIHAFTSQYRGLGYMSCSHNTSGKLLFIGTDPPPYYTKFPENCESPWVTPLI